MCMCVVCMHVYVCGEDGQGPNRSSILPVWEGEGRRVYVSLCICLCVCLYLYLCVYM